MRNRCTSYYLQEIDIVLVTAFDLRIPINFFDRRYEVIVAKTRANQKSAWEDIQRSPVEQGSGAGVYLSDKNDRQVGFFLQI